ncbi:MAG: hypothetical protein ACREQM_05575 [Candidatus Dormibacteraceae bacterium]
MTRAHRAARSYPAAEDLATSFAQRRGGRWAVVEDFDHDGFLIMPEPDALAYIDAKDAEVQYVAGPAPLDTLDKTTTRRRGGRRDG